MSFCLLEDSNKIYFAFSNKIFGRIKQNHYLCTRKTDKDGEIAQLVRASDS